MLGLFRVTYDHYTWVDLEVVSEDRAKLKQHCEDNNFYLVNKEKAKNIRGEEHYIIEELEVL